MPSERLAANKAKASISELKKSELSDASQDDVAEASSSSSKKQTNKGRKKSGGSDDGQYNPPQEMPPPKPRVKKIQINRKKHDLQTEDKPNSEEPEPKKLCQTRSMTDKEQFVLGLKAFTKKYDENTEQLASCQEKVQRLVMEAKENKENAAQMRQQCINLKQQFHEAKGAASAFQETNKKLLQDLDAKSNRIVELLQENKKDMSGYTKVDDDYIQMTWNQLCFSISNLVARNLQGTLVAPMDGFSSTEVNELFTKCTGSPHLRNFRLQGHIWRRLLQWVFTAQFGIWAGATGRLHTLYCYELTAALIHGPLSHAKTKGLSISKAKTATELDEAWGSNEDGIRKLVNTLHNDVRLFVLPDTSAQFLDEAFEVVRKALRLHVIFMKSRAFFNLFTPINTTTRAITEADSAVMEVLFKTTATSRTREFIDFVVSPGLEKIGNADGEAFNQRSILCKARYVARGETITIDNPTAVTDSALESMRPAKMGGGKNEDKNECNDSGDELADSQQPARELRGRHLVKKAVRDKCPPDGKQDHAISERPNRREKGTQPKNLLGDEERKVIKSIEVDSFSASAFQDIQDRTCLDANRARDYERSKSLITIAAGNSQSEGPEDTARDDKKCGLKETPTIDDSASESEPESDTSIPSDTVAK